MSDPNPYQSPGEYDESSMPSSDGWPKYATVVLDVDTYVRGYRVHNRRTWISRVVIAAISVWLIFTAVRLIQTQETLLATFSISAAVFLILLAVNPDSRRRKLLLKTLEEMGKQCEEVRYEISPEQFRFITEEADIRLPWDRFLKWKEKNGILLLYRSSINFIIVPTERLSPDVADAIRTCLRENTPA